MIQGIIVDVIEVISQLTGLFRWGRTLRNLERVAFILQAAREIVLIKDHMCSGKDHIGGAHEQEVVLIDRGNTNVSH